MIPIRQRKHEHLFHDEGHDWWNRISCGYGSLQMRVVAVLSGFKRFVRLLLRLEIGAFAEYL